MEEDIKKLEETKFALFLEKMIRKFGERSFIGTDGNLYRLVLRTVEKPLIEYALDKTRGNQLRAAKRLGINRNTLHSKIKKLGIEVGRWKL